MYLLILYYVKMRTISLVEEKVVEVKVMVGDIVMIDDASEEIKIGPLKLGICDCFIVDHH